MTILTTHLGSLRRSQYVVEFACTKLKAMAEGAALVS